jgi:hypothetical protein
MPSVSQTTGHAGGVIVFARGETCCTVCAPISAHKVVVEAEASRREPRGSVLAWRTMHGPIADGPNPRPCPHQAGCVHWILERELRR